MVCPFLHAYIQTHHFKKGNQRGEETRNLYAVGTVWSPIAHIDTRPLLT